MIKVIIFKQKHISLGFKIEGHALSREEIESTTGDAYDMICNSVSVLSQSAVIGMQEVLKETKFNLCTCRARPNLEEVF